MMAVDSYTKLFLPCTGTDGSTTFTDDSGNHTVTAQGNAQIDTAQYKFSPSSGLFDGSGDYLTVPDSDDWRLDDGSNSNLWTIDLWLRFASISSQNFVSQGSNADNRWTFYYYSNYLGFYANLSGATRLNLQFTWSPSTATWYHLALVKQGTTGYRCFVNGTQIGSTQTDTDTIPNYSGSLLVASTPGISTSNFHGWLQCLRIRKGFAYTSNFTPPASLADYYLKTFVPKTIWFMGGLFKGFDKLGKIIRPEGYGRILVPGIAG